jgi:guanosine-3',5'-bis(diphosphate) 3'-pyrophosphohydrolase
MPGPMVSQAKQQLKTIIDAYLTESDVERVLAACDYADIAHDGITRKSGEPYILHPIAVSCILAHMRLDAETLMAALLHDVIEDTDFSKEDIAEKFGKTISELVDGVTKLSQSSDKEYNKAALMNFNIEFSVSSNFDSIYKYIITKINPISKAINPILSSK